MLDERGFIDMIKEKKWLVNLYLIICKIWENFGIYGNMLYEVLMTIKQQNMITEFV